MKDLRIIAIAGKARSGKDTFGRMLIEAEPSGSRLAFADKLKDLCRELYGLSDEDVNTEDGKNRVTNFKRPTCPVCKSTRTAAIKLEGLEQFECHDCNAVGQPSSFAGAWTVRDVLKHVGTEGFRAVDPDVWLNYTIAHAREVLSGPVVKRKPRYVVITDCRFKSEVAGVKEVGGEVWRIRRTETDRASTDAHQSEIEVDSIPDSEFARVVVNDGSLDDLRATARDAVAAFLRARD